MFLRSAPEQKLPPAPVTTMQRTSSLRDASSYASNMRISIAPESAFMRSGRFIVRIIAWPSRSTSRSGTESAPLARGARRLERRVDARVVLEGLGQRGGSAELEHALGVGEHVRVVARQP